MKYKTKVEKIGKDAIYDISAYIKTESGSKNAIVYVEDDGVRILVTLVMSKGANNVVTIPFCFR